MLKQKQRIKQLPPTTHNLLYHLSPGHSDAQSRAYDASAGSGQLLAWGEGSRGQLGISLPEVKSRSVVETSTPHATPHATPATAVAVAVRVALGGSLRQDGGVTVASVSARAVVHAVAAAEQHALALDSLGRVWAWGCGKHGQLGGSAARSSATPRLLRSLESVRNDNFAGGLTTT